MKKYTADGDLEQKVIVSKFELFTRRYKLSKNVVAMLEAWPTEEARHQPSMKLLGLKSAVQFLVVETYAAAPTPPLAIHEKPRVGVFVTQKYKKSELKMPVYGVVCHDDNGSDIPTKCFEIKGLKGDEIWYVKPCPKDMGIVATNFLSHESNEEKVNVHIEYKPAELTFDKKKIKVLLPWVVNTKILQDGDELVLHRAALVAAPQIKRQIMVGSSSGSKKPKPS